MTPVFDLGGMANATAVNQTVYGALVMGCAVIGVFFLRFWRTTRDRLFAMFALAFWALGLNWLGLAVLTRTDEARTAFYVVRLAAFVLILLAIVDKNRSIRTVSHGTGGRPRPASPTLPDVEVAARADRVLEARPET